MDNGAEVKPNYALPENVIGVDENYLCRLMAEAEKLGSSFPLCSDLLARGMLTFCINLLIDSEFLRIALLRVYCPLCRKSLMQ